jgi:chaperonin cofactor prefoldin
MEDDHTKKIKNEKPHNFVLTTRIKTSKKKEDDIKKKWEKMEDNLKKRIKKENDLKKMEDEPINQNQPKWL